jgi:hypothetical protein
VELKIRTFTDENGKANVICRYIVNEKAANGTSVIKIQ